MAELWHIAIAGPNVLPSMLLAVICLYWISVIAGAVGGIPLQITNKYSGLLTRSVQGTAHAIKQLINEPEYARKLGINGREHIKSNYLITRHIKDYLLLFISLSKNGRDIVYL